MRQRQTKKREDGLYEDIDECVVSNCSNKLGELEDIEDELGINLRVLFKALRNNCYIKIKDRIVETLGGGSLTDECKYIEFDVDGKDYCNRYDVETIYFGVKDYGKTWAFTKEELL